MGSPEYERGPSPDRPINAPGKRPSVGPAVMVLLIFAVIAAVVIGVFALG